MRRRWEVAGVALLIVGGAATPLWAARVTPEEPRRGAPLGRWLATSSVSATEGDYGTSDTTTVTQVSQAVTYRGQTGELGVTVPYLFRRGTATIPGESRRARREGIPSDAEGLGDLLLRGRQFLIPGTATTPAVDLTAMVKIPTADEDDGLGTGRVDAGVGGAVSQPMGRATLFGEAGVVGRDRPGGSTLKPVRVDYAAGLGYAVAEWLSAFVSLEGSTKTSDGAEQPLELVVTSLVRLSDRVQMQAFVLAGLTDGSPAVGAGAGVTLAF